MLFFFSFFWIAGEPPAGIREQSVNKKQNQKGRPPGSSVEQTEQRRGSAKKKCLIFLNFPCVLGSSYQSFENWTVQLCADRTQKSIDRSHLCVDRMVGSLS